MRILPVLFLFLITAICQSQNWQPVNRVHHYNYFSSSTFSSASIIQTDSISTQGTDSLFHLNRVVKSIPSNTAKELINQEQFLGKTVTQRANGLVTFMGSKHFTLNIYAHAGNSWTFDTANGYIATIVLVKYDTLFGQHDSMKVIGVSNLDTIVLSKHHGIVSFKDASSGLTWSLKGIQNLNLGYHIPGYSDFFDFNPGDVFEYSHHKNYGPPSIFAMSFNTYHYKLTITGKTVNGNHVSYMADKVETDTLWGGYMMPYNIVHFTGQTTMDYYDSTSNYLYGNNNQEILVPFKDSTNYYFQPLMLNKAMYFGYNNTFLTATKWHKEQYFTPFSADSASADYAWMNWYYCTNSCICGKGFGFIEYHSLDGDSYSQRAVDIFLLGCRKGNTVYGHLSPDSLILHNTPPLAYTISPTLLVNNTILKISGKELPCDVSIFSMDGRLVFSQKVFTNQEASTQLDLIALAHGMYFVQISDVSGSLYSAKIVKN